MVLKEAHDLISSGIVAMLLPEVPVKTFWKAELFLAPINRTRECASVDSTMFPHGFEEIEHNSALQAGPVCS